MKSERTDTTAVCPGDGLLDGSSPRHVLERIAAGDPLDLKRRCARRSRERRLLVSTSRLTVRAFARVAYAAASYHGAPGLDPWLRERIDEASNDVLREDRRLELAKCAPVVFSHYERAARILRVDPSLGRRASVLFNDLPFGARRTYLALVVGGKTIHRYVAEGNGPPARIRSHLREAARALARVGSVDDA